MGDNQMPPGNDVICAILRLEDCLPIQIGSNIIDNVKGRWSALPAFLDVTTKSIEATLAKGYALGLGFLASYQHVDVIW